MQSLLILLNQLTAIDINWCQMRRTLKCRRCQMASWIPHLTLVLISHEGYQVRPWYFGNTEMSSYAKEICTGSKGLP